MVKGDFCPDYLLDGLTYLVVRLKPRNICANVAFLNRYAPDAMLRAELGYGVTTFAVALQNLLKRGVAEDDLDSDWIVFRRGKRRFTEAERRRLIEEFLEDCVIVPEPGPPEAPQQRGSSSSSSAGDEIDKEWVLLGAKSAAAAPRRD